MGKIFPELGELIPEQKCGSLYLRVLGCFEIYPLFAWVLLILIKGALMDTLARTKKLEALGFDRPRAEGLVQMVKQSIDEEVAKKTDLIELRSELRQYISDVRTELKLEIGEIKGEIKNSRLKTIVWLGGIMFSLISLMFAGLVYLEPIRKILITNP